jgi:hypothetical protein
MLEAVELPARIPHLDARLPDMDADDLPHISVSPSLCASVLRPWERRSRHLHGEEACEPKRLAPLHTGKGRAPEQTGEKEDKAAQLRQTGTFFRKQKATDGVLRHFAHVGRKATPMDKGGLASNNDYS